MTSAAPPPTAAPTPTVASSSDTAKLGRRTFGTLDWVQLGSAILAAVSVYLPWLRSSGTSVNAFDVPSLFLVNNETTERGVELGILVFVCAGIVLAGLLVRTPVMSKLVLAAGIALIVMGLLFILQVNRTFANTGVSLTDVLGFGPIAMIAAGGATTYVGWSARQQR
jgi:amino acid permease